MVRRLLYLRDEERMFAHFCDLMADVCTRGATAYKKNTLNILMKSELVYGFMSEQGDR